MSLRDRAAIVTVEGDQDDHCRLTFMGENWRILAMRGHLILLTNENGQKVLDASQVRWPEYITAAYAWLFFAKEESMPT